MFIEILAVLIALVVFVSTLITALAITGRLSDFLGWGDEHHGTVEASATIVLVVVTIVYAAITLGISDSAKDAAEAARMQAASTDELVRLTAQQLNPLVAVTNVEVAERGGEGPSIRVLPEPFGEVVPSDLWTLEFTLTNTAAEAATNVGITLCTRQGVGSEERSASVIGRVGALGQGASETIRVSDIAIIRAQTFVWMTAVITYSDSQGSQFTTLVEFSIAVSTSPEPMLSVSTRRHSFLQGGSCPL